MADVYRNCFLRSLPADTQAALKPYLHFGRLDWNRVIVDPGEALTTVYFPEGAVISLLNHASDGETVETTMVGLEGAMGLIEAGGSGTAAASAITQVDGDSWSAPVSVCRRLLRADPGFAEVSGRLFEMMLIESRQSGLCQALHGVEQRMARWLCESDERSGGRNPLPLTQEFLASMLGVQRTTVNAVASLLQRSGVVRYSRGTLHIVDREGLERRACECLDNVRDQRARLGFAVAA